MKRFLKSSFLMILMVFCISSISCVYASDDSGTWGDSLAWAYNEATNTLVIDGNGEIPYTNQYYLHTRPWAAYSSKITNVIIGEGVTAIGDCAFMNCSKLTTITVPVTVTKIGGGAFYGCSSLSSLHFPGNVTEIGVKAFYNCSSLTSVNIPDTVTAIGDDTFYNCKSLTKIILPDGVVYNAYFSGCSSLKELVLPDSITTLAEYAFYNCYKLESITLSDAITEIPAGAFDECKSLKVIEMSEGITSIENSAFYNCSSLVTIKLPKSLNYIGESAFRNCSSLILIVLPEQVSYLGAYAFSGCSELKVVELSDSLTYLGNGVFQRCNTLSSVELPDQLTTIASSLFYYCGGLEAVLIPESVVLINSMAFYGCDSLSAVYYSGSNEQWRDIVIHNNNDGLNEIKMHYNAHCIHKITYSAPIFATCIGSGMSAGSICAKCGEVFQVAEEIPALGHDYAEGYCTRCGDEDPNYVHNPFTDVAESDWFYAPVLWAVAEGVTGGKTETTFAPNEGCTRAQVVTFLWAANGKPEPVSMDNPFTDVADDAWYLKPVLWAVENGITTGISATEFGPDQTCTRAQIATFLWAANGKMPPKGQSDFVDVANGDWYAAPIIWAKENDITGGIGEGKFGPNDTCTRAQVVTFLKKVYDK